MFVEVGNIKIDLDKISTDSDILDFAEDNGIEASLIFDAIYKLETTNTPCEGCKNIGLRYGLFPCNICIRNPKIQDCYIAKG